jgi:hypothetical protein
MWTVEYFWERLFLTRIEADEFALEIGPVYGMIPRSVFVGEPS